MTPVKKAIYLIWLLTTLNCPLSGLFCNLFQITCYGCSPIYLFFMLRNYLLAKILFTLFSAVASASEADISPTIALPS